MADDGARRVYGFVESVAKPNQSGGYERMDLVLDAVDADAFDDGQAQARSPKHLVLVRVMTTTARFLALFGFQEVEEGDWLEVRLEPRRHAPRAWTLSAENDYVGPVLPTNVTSLARLSRRVGDLAGPRDDVAGRLSAWCLHPRRDRTPSQVRPAWPSPAGVAGRVHVRVLDVGQASCSALHVARDPGARILGYYDVGGPVFFHAGTAPRGLAAREGGRIPDRGFVILSHWDFDHYSLAITRLKDLQKLSWYAPDQAKGPAAAKLQVDLGSRLQWLDGPSVPGPLGARLHRGTGVAGDRNGTGYALRLNQGAEAVLLPGDVDYDLIDPAARTGLTGLAVTHHGGRGPSAPPTGHGDAVVSYGKPNRYRHPHVPRLAEHRSAGWSVLHTHDHGGIARADRWLTAP